MEITMITINVKRTFRLDKEVELRKAVARMK